MQQGREGARRLSDGLCAAAVAHAVALLALPSLRGGRHLPKAANRDGAHGPLCQWLNLSFAQIAAV